MYVEHAIDRGSPYGWLISLWIKGTIVFYWLFVSSFYSINVHMVMLCTRSCFKLCYFNKLSNSKNPGFWRIWQTIKLLSSPLLSRNYAYWVQMKLCAAIAVHTNMETHLYYKTLSLNKVFCSDPIVGGGTICPTVFLSSQFNYGWPIYKWHDRYNHVKEFWVVSLDSPYSVEHIKKFVSLNFVFFQAVIEL